MILRLAQLMRFVEAAECYEIALKLDPSNPVAFNNQAVILEDFGNFCESLHLHEKILEINPTYALPIYNKGRLCEKMGKYEQALECYDDLIKLDKSNIDKIFFINPKNRIIISTF